MGHGKMCVNETPAVELTAEKETTLRLEKIYNDGNVSYLSQLSNYSLFSCSYLARLELKFEMLYILCVKILKYKMD